MEIQQELSTHSNLDFLFEERSKILWLVVSNKTCGTENRNKNQSTCESSEAATEGTLACYTTLTWWALSKYLTDSEIAPSRLSKRSTCVVKANWALKKIIPEGPEEFINILLAQRSLFSVGLSETLLWQVQVVGPLHIVWFPSQFVLSLMVWKLSMNLEGMPQILVLNFHLWSSVKLLTSSGLLAWQINYCWADKESNFDTNGLIISHIKTFINCI